MAFRRSGPLRAFRIADMRHPIFDGSGAMLHGARWNSPGRRVIYAAETDAGALLEILVHASGSVPRSQGYVEIEIPAGLSIERNHAGRSAAVEFTLV
jgi:RES domain-containing protein